VNSELNNVSFKLGKKGQVEVWKNIRKCAQLDLRHLLALLHWSSCAASVGMDFDKLIKWSMYNKFVLQTSVLLGLTF
jgi:hypothetical protein